jgi:integrase
VIIMTESTAQDRPAKPYEGFPLYPHASGRWAKKINTKNHYFGKWQGEAADSWKGALELYQQQRDDLHAGRKPRVVSSGLSCGELVNRFLTDRGRKVNSGELSPRSLGDYLRSGERILKAFGKSRLVADLDQEDFGKLREAFAKKWGAVTLGNEIGRVRAIFRWGFDSGLLATPVRFGVSFTKPTRAVLRRARKVNGERLFTAAQVRTLIAAADPQLKAMILLAINCGLGNTDCSALERRHLDLDAALLDFPRPKTSVDRRAVLWSETVDAIRAALELRPAAKDQRDAECVFLTRFGRRWVRATKGTQDEDGRVLVKGGSAVNVLWQEYSKLLTAHLPDCKRTFYDLRHVYRTVADECRDQPAVMLTMGHADGTMGGVYRERIDDSRLRVVADTVHSWLYGGASNE